MQSSTSLFGLPPLGSVERRIYDLTRERFGVCVAVEVSRSPRSCAEWLVRVLGDGEDVIAECCGCSLVEALSLAEDALERWICEREDEIAEGRAIEASESREVA